MPIQFMCPNGHTLTAPDEHAGKEGKCPKCESEFLVPELEEFADAADSEEEETTTAEPAAADSAVKSSLSKLKADAEADDKIVFLCPNGHKLSGPASLKGKAGQCPHCDSKFMIPDDDDEEEEVEDEPIEEVAESQIGPPSKIGPPEPEQLVDDDFDAELPEDEAIEETIKPPLAGSHQLGAIFYQLNSVVDEDRLIELLLEDGQTIVANRISLTLSQSDYAVVAHVDNEKGASIVTVPWSEVKRATIRKLDELPDGWFV